MESTKTILSRRVPRASIYQHIHPNYEERSIESLQNDAYRKGHQDGSKDMEIELIKRGKALYQLALDKAARITEALISEATEKAITILSFHLKVEDWDNIDFIIIVTLEDFIDDKIDFLYQKAMALVIEYNDDTFHWNYNITYYSESLNREKILTDGFDYYYEHTPQPRKTQ